TDQRAKQAWSIFQEVETQGGMVKAATQGWVTKQIDAVQSVRDRNLATRKQAVTGISEHPNVKEEPVARPKPDLARLRVQAGNRLVSWRRDHSCEEPLANLAKVAAASRKPGALTEAAVKAAEAGATLGQISAALVGNRSAAQPAHVQPLVTHPYAAAYEELRDASEAYAATNGKPPQVFLANMGKPADFIGRATYALNFFEAGGFEAPNNDGFSDAAA